MGENPCGGKTAGGSGRNVKQCTAPATGGRGGKLLRTRYRDACCEGPGLWLLCAGEGNIMLRSACLILVILAASVRADEAEAVKALRKLNVHADVSVDESKPGTPVVGVSIRWSGQFI